MFVAKVIQNYSLTQRPHGNLKRSTFHFTEQLLIKLYLETITTRTTRLWRVEKYSPLLSQQQYGPGSVSIRAGKYRNVADTRNINK